MGTIGIPALNLKTHEMVPSITSKGDHGIFTYLDTRWASVNKIWGYSHRG
jgi:hypothetical protein